MATSRQRIPNFAVRPVPLEISVDIFICFMQGLPAKSTAPLATGCETATDTTIFEDVFGYLAAFVQPDDSREAVA
jgi:hypothetical protein